MKIKFLPNEMTFIRFAVFLALFTLIASGCETEQFFTELPTTDSLADRSQSALGETGGAMGSGGEDPIGITPAEGSFVEDEFHIPVLSSPQVDILFVVDNSGSMAGEQKILQESFDAFISAFVSRNIDFHLGVITTDTTVSPAGEYWSGTNPNSAFFGYIEPGLGRLLSKSNERYLTPASPNLSSQFKSNVKVGTLGSGQEQGLLSTQLALNSEASSFNQGFVRNDALLAVVIVSDEDETITNGETFEQRKAGFVSTLDSVKPSGSRGYRADFIINLDAVAPSPLPSYPQGLLPYPALYLETATQLGATPLNVSQNFSQPLINLGEDIAQQTENQYALSEVPTLPLIVKINGLAVDEDPLNGYQYDSLTNRVEINGSALASLPGSTLTIGYQSQ